MTRPCCKCSRCGTTFLCTNGEMENGYCSQHVLAYLFPDICGQRTMINKGAKRNVPCQLQAQQAPVCLWSISETLQCRKFHGIFTKSTVSRRVCWGLTVLWGSVSADFRQFQVEAEGKRKKDTGLTRRVNPNSHITHL